MKERPADAPAPAAPPLPPPVEPARPPAAAPNAVAPPPGSTPDAGRKRLWAVAAWVLLMAAILGATWQALHSDEKPQAAPKAGKAPPKRAPQREPDLAEPPSLALPADVLRDPASLSGLVMIDEDPPDLPPPSGSLRRGATRRRDGEIVEHFATYECRAGLGLADAAAHYRQRLKELGYLRLQDTDGADPVILTYCKGHASVTVSLRGPTEEYKMVMIDVRSSRPRETDDGE